MTPERGLSTGLGFWSSIVGADADAGGMTNLTSLFTGLVDRQRVLSDILDCGPAAAGTTLIGLVDRATRLLHVVHAIATPEPILGADSCFDSAQIRRLAGVLHDVAEAMAPQHVWTGSGWSVPTYEFITVVCRDGAAAISPTEVQFHYGWRFSNHFTEAFHGEVFVVTPRGWAALLGEWSAPQPALPPGAVPVPERVVQDAEQVIAEAGVDLLEPKERECLLCYVQRMLLAFGCGGLRFATHYRDVRAPRATGLERRLGQLGGLCDCEIFLNAYDLRSAYCTSEGLKDLDGVGYGDRETSWPDPLPSCLGVRAGSTQPCGLWYRRWR